jgi:nicotinate-nucleotide--dimethylbenzimidazole phosphoribosyltransferase
MTPNVLQHILDSISPSSAAHAQGARLLLSTHNLSQVLNVGVAIAGAQHSAKIRARKPILLVVAADHGIADPGIDLGDQHPTSIAASLIASGKAAVCHLARNAHASTVIVNAGMAHCSPTTTSIVSLAAGPTAKFSAERAALTCVDVMLSIEAGIALALSFADDGCDILGLGSIGLGGAESTAAVAGAMLGASVMLPPHDRDLQTFVELGAALASASPPVEPLELLAHLGGRDTALLLGVIVTCASLNIPVIVDDNVTVAAAAMAWQLSPYSVTSCIASHPGRGASTALLASLGLSPIFPATLGNGEGSAAAMVLALAKSAADLTAA